MQVVELEMRHVCVPLRRPVKHASHTRDESENLLVRCVLADGTVGWGEGVPREYVTGETVASAQALLRSSDLSGQLQPCSNFADVVAMLERLKLPAVPGDTRVCQGNAARCALELAILDAYGRSFQQPLSVVPRLIAPEIADSKSSVQYSGVILSAKGWKARALSLGYRLSGFQQVKVKVGIAGQNDWERLRIIRRWIGDGVDLRVDANEAWTPAQAVEMIRAFERFRISSVEQPVPHEQIEEFARVRQGLRIPIMLDESLCSEIDAERAIRENWCESFNLRLSKCGGLIPSTQLAALASRHGIGYQLGCQVGETAILSAAGRHFACGIAGLIAVEGSFDRHLLYDSLAIKDITFGRGGHAPALPGGGLGIDIAGSRVDRITISRETLIG